MQSTSPSDIQPSDTNKMSPIYCMHTNPFIIVIGMRCSGKTTTIQHLIKEWDNDPMLEKYIIISSNEAESNEYAYTDTKHIKLIYHRWDNHIIKNLLITQKKSKKKTICVFDDCFVTHGSWESDPYMIDLFLNSHKYNVHIIIGFQYPIAMCRAIRNKIDYVFMFQDNIGATQKRLFAHYGYIFPTFESFRNTLVWLTESLYSAMVIDMKAIIQNNHAINPNSMDCREPSKYVFQFVAPREDNKRLDTGHGVEILMDLFDMIDDTETAGMNHKEIYRYRERKLIEANGILHILEYNSDI